MGAGSHLKKMRPAHRETGASRDRRTRGQNRHFFIFGRSDWPLRSYSCCVYRTVVQLSCPTPAVPHRPHGSQLVIRRLCQRRPQLALLGPSIPASRTPHTHNTQHTAAARRSGDLAAGGPSNRSKVQGCAKVLCHCASCLGWVLGASALPAAAHQMQRRPFARLMALRNITNASAR
jgi:hypothetical protein